MLGLAQRGRGLTNWQTFFLGWVTVGAGLVNILSLGTVSAKWQLQFCMWCAFSNKK
jgi:hypothetical protein